MARLNGREKVEKGRELAPLRQKAFEALDQNPDLTPKQISKMVGVHRSTAQTWKNRWRSQKKKQEKQKEGVTARLTAAQQMERGRELAPLRQKAYQMLEENPDLTAQEISEMLGVVMPTAQTWKYRWRRKKKKQKEKGIAPEPVTTELAPEPVITEQAPEPVITELDPGCVADALLKKVVDALTEREELLAAIKEYKSLLSELEKALEAEKQEKDRILKIHNAQVLRKSMTDSDTIKRLAKL